MEIKLFYKTQRELALAINSLIDAYWENEINEEIFVRNIVDLFKNNNEKIVKDNTFTTILKQQCGKRRLDVMGKILSNNSLITDDKRSLSKGDNNAS